MEPPKSDDPGIHFVEEPKPPAPPPASTDPEIQFVEDVESPDSAQGEPAQPPDSAQGGPPPVYFAMTAPDDAGHGFKQIQFPKAEAPPPPSAPKPSREVRLAEARASSRARGRRSFLIGLLVGQVLIVGINLGLPLLLRLYPQRLRFEQDRLPLLICLGVVTGIAIIALLIFVLLFFAGLVGLFRDASVWRGIKRTVKAVFSIALTTAVLGGTAFAMIPRAKWKQVPADVVSMAKEGWPKLKQAFAPPKPPKD